MVEDGEFDVVVANSDELGLRKELPGRVSEVVVEVVEEVVGPLEEEELE